MTVLVVVGVAANFLFVFAGVVFFFLMHIVNAQNNICFLSEKDPVVSSEGLNYFPKTSS